MVSRLNSEIAKHYVRYADITVVQKGQGRPLMKRISLGRINFCFGMDLAALFLIAEIAKAFFNTLRVIVTLGCHQKSRNALCKNVQQGMVYGAAIPVGLFGMLVSPWLACKFLNIPTGAVPLKQGESLLEAMLP